MKFSRLPCLSVVCFFSLLVPRSRAASAELAASASAFVRGEAGSDVDWLPWEGDWARRAKAENKPVYFFVGSFLSELSQATCRQSFTNADTIEYLNRHFICVIVDREERPDFAAAAQYYLRLVKQGGGWPVNLWLTPDLQPYEGGGYLPPSEEWGKSGFSKAARQAGETWTTNPASCRRQAKEAMAMMAASPPDPTPALGTAELEKKLSTAAAAWRATFDATAGGFGTAPKNPEPELLRFLLRSSSADREMALATLRALRDGAMRDPLDGGFFRYSSDNAWHLPYLQKTLADQARLALAFLDAHQLTHDESFAGAARGALDYAISHLGLSAGGFAASEDGTADDRAGYFVWSASEIDTVLAGDSAAFKHAFAVKSEGNLSADDDPAGRYRGKNFLFRTPPAKEDKGDALFTSALQRLRAVRDRRPPLPLDDRATTGAHGLMLAALSRAGAQLHEPRYLEAANRTFAWAEKKLFLTPEGDLRRLRDSSAPAVAYDYAALALGCREYARAVRNSTAGQLATRLLARAGDLFFDPAQGIYLSAPATPTPGIFVRAPAPGDSLEAESLALLAGAPAAQATVFQKTLAATLGSDAPTAGEVMLALQRGAGE